MIINNLFKIKAKMMKIKFRLTFFKFVLVQINTIKTKQNIKYKES